MDGRDVSGQWRAVVLVLGSLALGSLALQFAASLPENNGSPLATAWSMARFFTILTNGIVAATYLRIGLTGRWVSASWLTGVTLWIAVVGLVYHALLAATHNPVGLGAISNVGLHTVVPLGTALVWVILAPKDGLRVADAAYWAIYPVIYALYALGRGLIDGTFPYFFLDPGRIGWGGVALYIAGLGALFLCLGLALIQGAKRLPR